MRPRRMSARALAFGLAVGLSGVLVGLSVAPRILPGDTLRLRPRIVAGATVDVQAHDGAIAHLSVRDAVSWFAASLTAVVPAPAVPAPVSLAVLAAGWCRPSVSATTVAATGCRGPPFSS